jgi:hypothetical protein
MILILIWGCSVGSLVLVATQMYGQTLFSTLVQLLPYMLQNDLVSRIRCVLIILIVMSSSLCKTLCLRLKSPFGLMFMKKLAY